MAGIVGTICRCTAILAAVSRAPRAAGFRPPHSSSGTLPRRPPSAPTTSSSSSSSSPSSSSLRAWRWPTLPPPPGGLLPKWPGRGPPPAATTAGERNGIDPGYPWAFGGRFVFRPSLVRVSPGGPRPPSAELLSLFGYSLGGSVILEYDHSPVGPYREYVTMGGVVGLGRVDAPGMSSSSSSLGLGQWGTDLYVSTAVAEDVCRRAWGVPARVASIEFEEDGDDLVDGPGDGDDDDDDDDDYDDGGGGGGGRRMRKFVLSGWGNARILGGSGGGGGDDDGARGKRRRYGSIPIFWTPTIKALWAPILLPLGGRRSGGGGRDDDDDDDDDAVGRAGGGGAAPAARAQAVGVGVEAEEVPSNRARTGGERCRWDSRWWSTTF